MDRIPASYQCDNTPLPTETDEMVAEIDNLPKTKKAELLKKAMITKVKCIDCRDVTWLIRDTDAIVNYSDCHRCGQTYHY